MTPKGPNLRIGGFIDTYYAYDLNAPADFERSYVTTAARHNEFNLNLAYLDARLDGERLRGRLALQAGNSVQANYVGEPALGKTSGPSLMQHVQEAFVGYRAFEHLWIDAGIMLSYIGLEGFISRDNWTYTRSLMADFSPYYQSGVRVKYQGSSPFSLSLNVMNGWQNVSENNSNKAVGAQVAFQPSPRFSFTYNNFLGGEVAGQTRLFNDLILKAGLTEALEVALTYDFGLQGRPSGGQSYWQGAALLARVHLTPSASVTGRVEYYADKDHVIVPVPGPEGLEAFGASANLDLELLKDLLWRTEVRGIWARTPIFPGRAGWSSNDGLVVTSLAYSF